MTNCQHPDHNDKETCLDRAIGCNQSCVCCMGELAKTIRVILLKPKNGQGWRVEVYFPRKNQFLPLNSCPWAKAAKMFLQCDSPEYLLYEFWTNNEEAIAQASLFLERYFLSIATGDKRQDWFFTDTEYTYQTKT